MGNFNLDINKNYTYADYLNWSFDETVELIKGVIFKMAPAPSLKHQRTSTRLIGLLYNFFDKKPCNLFHAPFDVRLPVKKNEISDEQIITVVQPDICVVCDEAKLEERGCLGAPDLIIEILSPGNSKKELQNKFEVYQESGVKEYWIVQPLDKYVTIYSLNENGEYIGSKPYTEKFKSIIFPNLEIDLETVFED
jgi:Uma2 family endonuclease